MKASAMRRLLFIYCICIPYDGVYLNRFFVRRFFVSVRVQMDVSGKQLPYG